MMSDLSQEAAPQGDDGDMKRVAAAVAGAGVGGVAGGVGAVAATEAVIVGMGFTSSSIVAGSTAAAMMSAEAIVAGGGVAAGGTVATLQTVGAVGLGAGPVAGISMAGSLAVGGLFTFVGFWVARAFSPDPKQHNFPPLPATPRKTTECALRGKWMVLTEEGWGNVLFYPLETEAEAYRFFYDLRQSRPKILFDTSGNERESGGWNPFAPPTIRGQYGLALTSIDDGFSHPLIQPGNTIALYSHSAHRFVRVVGDSVDGNGGLQSFENLPDTWDSARFLVVDAGGGKIALHSASHECFVRVAIRSMGGGGRIAPGDLGTWTLERLTVVDAGDGRVALHFEVQNCFIRMMPGGRVDGKGGCRNAGSLPRAWEAERFAVRLC